MYSTLNRWHSDMKRFVKLFLLVILQFAFLHAYCQNPLKQYLDGLPWRDSMLAEGVYWKSVHIRDSSLFNSRQNLNLIRLRMNGKSMTFKVARTHPDGGMLTSDLAKQHSALAAVNASFFNVQTGQSVNWIKENGVTKDTSVLKGGKYGAHQTGIFVFSGMNAAILPRDTNSGMNWEAIIDWPNAIESGPVLLLNGKKIDLKVNAFNKNRHPRTCACITADEIILLTADGRTNEAYGLSLFELSDLLEALGCTDAINFDGGGSTTMYVRNRSGSGVVNMPCDNRLFDHEGERRVSNALLIVPK